MNDNDKKDDSKKERQDLIDYKPLESIHYGQDILRGCLIAFNNIVKDTGGKLISSSHITDQN